MGFDPALAITSPSFYEPKEFDKVEMYLLLPTLMLASPLFLLSSTSLFAIKDKISNTRDGSPALLIHGMLLLELFDIDDGGGLDSKAMRRCMSFGFSDKNSKLSIGQYGNGFKASSMRLGADAIVFSRHLNNGNLTELLTYKRMVSMTKMGLMQITDFYEEKFSKLTMKQRYATNFETRRHLAMMIFPEVKEDYEELHEMLIDRSQLLTESFEYIARDDP
ncbi:protein MICRORCHIDIA [Trifolium repens]|nr:protein MICRORCHIDIA [Trifolium repens]